MLGWQRQGRSADHLRRDQEFFLLVLIIPAFLLGAAFLYFIGADALVGRHPFQFFADSNTYHDIYSGFMATPDGFIDVSYNFLGPLLILSMVGGNIYLVLAINIIIFVVSLISISRMLDINPLKAAAVQFLCPMTALSLLSVNKEILFFPVLALLIAAYRNRSILAVLCALGVSLLARWQLTVFCVTLVGIFFLRSMNRYLLLALLTMAVSIGYTLAQGFLEPVLRFVEASTLTYTEGSGFFELLNEIQNDGFYFAVAPLKAAHLLFSLGIKVDRIFYPIDIYNDQIVGLFSLMNITFLMLLIAKRRVLPNNDIVMISIVYLIVFALTPVYAPRYFYPVAVMWAFVIAGGVGHIRRNATRLDQTRRSIVKAGV